MAAGERLPSIEDLGRLDDEAFAAALAPLFEGAPRFVRRIAAQRPYASWNALLDAAEPIALAMPEADQLELINAHPRVGAPPASVSALSFREQGHQREAQADADDEAATAAAEAERLRVQTALDRLNDLYETRFGFRFVIHVAGRSRAEIVPIMEARLDADRGSEKRRALHDVAAIARDRASTLAAAAEQGDGR